MNKHIIFTNGRSGSNYLANLLNQHPQITNYGEVLGDWTLPYQLHLKYSFGGSSDLEYLHYIYQSQTFFWLAQFYSAYAHVKEKKKINFKTWHQLQSLGIKDFSIHFHRRNLQSFLLENGSLKVINLYRDNSLKRYISLVYMGKTGVIKTTKASSNEHINSTKVAIDVDELLAQLKIYETEKEEQLSLVNQLEAHRVLNIRYEDYFGSDEAQEQYNNSMFELLGVKALPTKIKSRQQKILSDSLSEIIANYEQIYDRLQNTPYAKYL